jgi:hypothetical protein
LYVGTLRSRGARALLDDVECAVDVTSAAEKKRTRAQQLGQRKVLLGEADLMLHVVDDILGIRRAQPCSNLCNLANRVAKHSPPARAHSHHLGGFTDDCVNLRGAPKLEGKVRVTAAEACESLQVSSVADTGQQQRQRLQRVLVSALHPREKNFSVRVQEALGIESERDTRRGASVAPGTEGQMDAGHNAIGEGDPFGLTHALRGVSGVPTVDQAAVKFTLELVGRTTVKIDSMQGAPATDGGSQVFRAVEEFQPDCPRRFEIREFDQRSGDEVRITDHLGKRQPASRQCSTFLTIQTGVKPRAGRVD